MQSSLKFIKTLLRYALLSFVVVIFVFVSIDYTHNTGGAAIFEDNDRRFLSSPKLIETKDFQRQ